MVRPVVDHYSDGSTSADPQPTLPDPLREEGGPVIPPKAIAAPLAGFATCMLGTATSIPELYGVGFLVMGVWAAERLLRTRRGPAWAVREPVTGTNAPKPVDPMEWAYQQFYARWEDEPISAILELEDRYERHARGERILPEEPVQGHYGWQTPPEHLDTSFRPRRSRERRQVIEMALRNARPGDDAPRVVARAVEHALRHEGFESATARLDPHNFGPMMRLSTGSTGTAQLNVRWRDLGMTAAVEWREPGPLQEHVDAVSECVDRIITAIATHQRDLFERRLRRESEPMTKKQMATDLAGEYDWRGRDRLMRQHRRYDLRELWIKTKLDAAQLEAE